MLQVNIRKQLGSFTLRTAFETDGEIMGLLGSSGCGKSMTLKCIAGIEKPDSGRIVLNGRVLFDSERHINLPVQERRVGYLFQQYALFPQMNVFRNIEAGCPIRDKAARKQAVTEKIAAMDLTGLENMRPSRLSGGQQQRVALARILINEPELLLLDEPFSALDDYLKWRMEIELHDTLRAFGRDALFVSHSRDEVYRLCDTVCVLDHGQSQAKLDVRTLFAAPETLAACVLSGCKNFSKAHYAAPSRVFAEEWGFEVAVNEQGDAHAPYVGLRSHFIVLSPVPLDLPNCFLCPVERAIEDVFSQVVLLRTLGGATLRAELTKAEWKPMAEAKELYVGFPTEAVMTLRNA